jgi:hypothetical protein
LKVYVHEDVIALIAMDDYIIPEKPKEPDAPVAEPTESVQEEEPKEGASGKCLRSLAPREGGVLMIATTCLAFIDRAEQKGAKEREKEGQQKEEPEGAQEGR